MTCARSILDIERSGVPPAPEMDAYLKSRLDRLAAQLAVRGAGNGQGMRWAGEAVLHGLKLGLLCTPRHARVTQPNAHLPPTSPIPPAQ